MVEMVVCTVLLSAVAAVVAPGIKAVFEQRKQTRYETLVMLELNNQQVQLQAGTEPEALQLSEWFADRYPAAQLKTETLPSDAAAPNLIPLRLSLVRPSENGLPDVRRSLVVWTQTSESTP